ncbi:MAG TPA: hypothetical protein VF803_03680 [Candidatus Paceibacterota bacterium]
MFRPEQRGTSARIESQPKTPHIVTLESMEEQIELQQRLALMAYQHAHIGFAPAIDPIKPETVDMEVRDGAMKAWVEEYAEAFRQWIDMIDQKRTIINMDDYGTIERIFNEVLYEASGADDLE